MCYSRLVAMQDKSIALAGQLAVPSVFFLGPQHSDIGMENAQVGAVRAFFSGTRKCVLVPFGLVHEYLSLTQGAAPKPSSVNKFLVTMTQA